VPSDTGYNDNHQDEVEETSPTIQCLRDIINDDDYDKYSGYSEINGTQTASLGESHSIPPIKMMTHPQPTPEPPPSHPTVRLITVEDVIEYQYKYNEQFHVGITYTELQTDTKPPQTDLSHLLRDTSMFPTSELEEWSISPATILTMLAQEDALHFSCKITKKLLVQQLFCLQIDGGTNRSVTNNRY